MATRSRNRTRALRLARDPEAGGIDERFSELAAYIGAGEVVLSWHGKEKGPTPGGGGPKNTYGKDDGTRSPYQAARVLACCQALCGLARKDHRHARVLRCINKG